MTTDFKQAEHEIVIEHQQREKTVNEEFKIWKKTVPLFYDTISTYALQAPLLAFQWLPDYTVSDNKNKISVKFLVGTSTPNDNKDTKTLILGSVDLPSTLAPDFSQFLTNNSQGIPIPLSNVDSGNSFKIISSWNHPSNINVLKLSPDNSKVITFGNEGDVFLYDLKGTGSPIEFKYHKLTGTALEWVDDTKFLSASQDSQIALWDVGKPSTPIQVFKSHTAAVNDLSYNKGGNGLFASVSDDYTTQIHDLKAKPTDADKSILPVIKVENKHIQNAINFHPEIPTLFITGGNDNNVSLYDLRKPQVPIRKFFGHNDTVIGLQWDEVCDPSVFLSWSLDKRVLLWDITALDEDFTYPTSEEPTNSRRKHVKTTDPCLKFIHGGHTRRINQAVFHPVIKGIIASCGSDNLLEVWKVKSSVEKGDDEVDEDEKDTEMKD